jgi:hypothetical protein
MLRRAGILRDQDVARVAALVHAGASHVDALVELELIGEHHVVEFCRNALSIPVASPEVLARLDSNTAAQVPAEMAWAHLALPVSVDDVGNLTLAMADPTDERAVTAVAAHTGAYLVRAVAPVGALREAIARVHGSPSTEVHDPSAPLRLRVMAPPSDTPALPLSAGAFATFLPQLLACADRDAILDGLLEFLGAGFERVILFVHLRNQLRGKDARGPDLLREAVTQVRIPTTGPSVFSDVIARASPHYGAWPTERMIDRAFHEAMGGVTGDVLVLPIRLRGHVPVLVFAARSQHPVDPVSIQPLADAVSHALERLIFRRKAQAV